MEELIKFIAGMVALFVFSLGLQALGNEFQPVLQLAESAGGFVVVFLMAVSGIVLSLSVIEWLIRGKKSFLGGG